MNKKQIVVTKPKITLSSHSMSKSKLKSPKKEFRTNVNNIIDHIDKNSFLLEDENNKGIYDILSNIKKLSNSIKVDTHKNEISKIEVEQEVLFKKMTCLFNDNEFYSNHLSKVELKDLLSIEDRKLTKIKEEISQLNDKSIIQCNLNNYTNLQESHWDVSFIKNHDYNETNHNYSHDDYYTTDERKMEYYIKNQVNHIHNTICKQQGSCIFKIESIRNEFYMLFEPTNEEHSSLSHLDIARIFSKQTENKNNPKQQAEIEDNSSLDIKGSKNIIQITHFIILLIIILYLCYDIVISIRNN